MYQIARFKLLSFLLWMMFFPTIGNASQIIDSLERKLKNANDTATVDIKNKLSSLYWNIDINKAEKIVNEAIAQAKKMNYQRGIATGYNHLGVVYDIKGKTDSAMLYYKMALPIARSLQETITEASILNNIGLLHWNFGNLDSAVFYYLESARVFEITNTKIGLANTYNNIGLVYHDLKQYRKSIDYTFLSISYRQILEDLYGLGAALGNLANTYEQMEMLDSSQYYLDSSINIKTKINDNYGLGLAYMNKGMLMSKLNNLPEAEKMYFKSIQLKTKSDDQLGLSMNYYGLANIYNKQSKFPKALEFAEKSLDISIKLNAKKRIEAAYIVFSGIYENMGNFKDALIFNKKADSLRALIQQEDINEQVAQAEQKYQSEKKDRTIQALEQEKQIEILEKEKAFAERKTYLVGGIFAVLAVLGIWYLVRAKEKNQQKIKLERAIKEQQLEQFGAVILAEEMERKRIAQELHDGLGQILSTARLNVSCLEDAQIEDIEDRKSLKIGLELIDDACSEVRNISHNMMPNALIKRGFIEALRELVVKINAAHKIHVTFEGDFQNTLSESLEVAIYRILQEITNNILKHSQAENLQIGVSQNQNQLHIKIEEDGKGFNPEEVMQNSTGIGWKNIQARLQMLKAKMEVKSEVGAGSLVEIFIPTT